MQSQKNTPQYIQTKHNSIQTTINFLHKFTSLHVAKPAMNPAI